MAAAFEIGNPDRPKGHALLYFRTSGGGEVVATYVVVLPIAINAAKYIPPAFAARIPQPASEVAAAALPPIPESMENVEHVRRLAQRRDDDLLDGGVIEADPEQLMVAAHEAAQAYAAQYQRTLEAEPAEAPAPEAPDEDTLRWMLMGEKERIGELAKLTGQLRYALDGGDDRLQRATVAQMEKLQALLPEKYRIGEFLVAAQQPGDKGRRLAELYIDRCYKLSNEEYEALRDLDRQIEEMQNAK